jgi:Uma2 family endonuclease
MAAPIQPLLTVEDLEAMPEDGNRYEVIEGELFVSEAPGLTHQRVSLMLTVGLGSYLRDNPIGCIWPTPGVVFSEISGVIPDIVYVRNERRAEIASGERVEGAPDLVIEIVSPGPANEQRDRIAKKRLYAKHGVKEYWLVDPATQTIETFVLRDSTLQPDVTFGEQDLLVSSLLPGFSCKVEAIFRR